MLVLGLQGSPRKKGNTSYLLQQFMHKAQQLGATTQTIHADERDIMPCKEYIVCEKKGFCPIKDDMHNEIYALLRRADVIVMASPIFFYNVTAQLKALIDRSQTLWARKYKLRLTDPARHYRKGFMLAVGATKGRNLFEGVSLTAKYFFDAVGAEYAGKLTYRYIENKGDMEKHPNVLDDVDAAVSGLLQPLLQRKRIIFHGHRDACLSQMACAFAQLYAGDRIEALSGGASPAEIVDPLVEAVMREKDIDMAFRVPRSIASAMAEGQPELIVNIGDISPGPGTSDIPQISWPVLQPAEKTEVLIRGVRDDIEKNVKELLETV